MKREQSLIVLTAVFACLCLAAPWNASAQGPGLSAFASGTSVTIQWTPVPGASGYLLYFAPPLAANPAFPDMSALGVADLGNIAGGTITLPEGNAFYLALQSYSAAGPGSLSNIGFFETGASPADTVKILGANDLGMHCVDKEFSVFSMLPPFNVVHAQAVLPNPLGLPRLLDGTAVSLRYRPAADPTGSINSTSINKTGFWQFSAALFGAQLQAGQGLTGSFMPMDNFQSLGPQPMPFDAQRAWFSGEGVPLLPLDDLMRSNPYPIMEISAHDPATGQNLGSTRVVLPVSAETDCSNCHATGRMAAPVPGPNWSADADIDVQTKTNILILHDIIQGTTLRTSTPVLCAGCHYSPALDLAGTGPQGLQVGRKTFSNVMHFWHGNLIADAGGPVFPPDGTVEQTCYQCHPGLITQCQRGAMKTGGMVCHDCHGNMLSVGGATPLLPGGSIDGVNDGGVRRPWQDLPRCQSCHTGDAVNHLPGADLVVSNPASPFRLRQAYRNGDSSASPLLAPNDRFAENLNTLFRFSRGHGGISCEGCHGSTHAIWPNADVNANDNITATELQGHSGTIIECLICHPSGSLPLVTNGPHGIHSVNDPRWNRGGHETPFVANRDSCRACHGLDLLGTALSRAAVDRSLIDPQGRTVSVLKGQPVRCDLCHGLPG